jgi:leader peptidase (prepilin peptidase)/N-methyltransferase
LVLIVFRFNLLSGNLPVLIELIRFFLVIVLVTLLVFSAVFDIKYLILPDFATIMLIIISSLGVLFDEPNIIPYLLSAIGAAGGLGFLYLITKGKGMGFGDVKLAVFMGLFLGWPNIIVAMYVAFVTGALFGLVGMVSKKMTKKTQIPFGPFLILGTLVALIWGKEIINLSVFLIFG